MAKQPLSSGVESLWLEEVWPYFVVPGIFHLKTGSFWIPVSLWLCLGNGCIHFCMHVSGCYSFSKANWKRLDSRSWEYDMGTLRNNDETVNWIELGDMKSESLGNESHKLDEEMRTAQNRMKNSHRKSREPCFKEEMPDDSVVYFFPPFFEVIYIFAVNIYLTSLLMWVSVLCKWSPRLSSSYPQVPHLIFHSYLPFGRVSLPELPDWR